jgi:hypothetical protein
MAKYQENCNQVNQNMIEIMEKIVLTRKLNELIYRDLNAEMKGIYDFDRNDGSSTS